MYVVQVTSSCFICEKPPGKLNPSSGLSLSLTLTLMTESQLLLQEHVDLSYSQDEDDPLIGFTINFLPSSTSYSDSQDAPRGGTGSQVLPVASLADDWNDVPATGDEYLFLVRRELSGLSPVTRVVNPYHQEFPPESISQHKPVREDRPSQVWRKAFLDQFVAMRDVGFFFLPIPRHPVSPYLKLTPLFVLDLSRDSQMRLLL